MSTICKSLLFFIAYFIVVMPTQATAEFKNGNKLYEGCQADNYKEKTFAMVYITGVYDDLELQQHVYERIIKDYRPEVCLPSAVTAGQMNDVVCKGLADNPQERQYSAPFLIGQYLHNAFPCANK